MTYNHEPNHINPPCQQLIACPLFSYFESLATGSLPREPNSLNDLQFLLSVLTMPSLIRVAGLAPRPYFPRQEFNGVFAAVSVVPA